MALIELEGNPAKWNKSGGEIQLLTDLTYIWDLKNKVRGQTGWNITSIFSYACKLEIAKGTVGGINKGEDEAMISYEGGSHLVIGKIVPTLLSYRKSHDALLA